MSFQSPLKQVLRSGLLELFGFSFIEADSLAIKSSLSSGLNEARINMYKSVILVVSNMAGSVLKVTSAKVMYFFQLAWSLQKQFVFISSSRIPLLPQSA